MNNKGFAITSIIYGLMLLFVVVVSSFLSILVGRNRRMDELVEGVYDSVEYSLIIVSESSSETSSDYEQFDNKTKTYVTEERGLYYFLEYDCEAFLPKSVVIINGETKGSGDSNNLYYSLGGGESLDDYKLLTCLKS